MMQKAATAYERAEVAQVNAWLSPDAIAARRGVRAVLEILDGDGEPAGLQLVIADGSSLILTDWTDWTLRIDELGGVELPDYFWPPEAYSAREVCSVAEGVDISRVEAKRNEVGEVVGIVLHLGLLGIYDAGVYGGSFRWSMSAV